MFAIDYEDLGTPAPVDAGASVTVEIDGKPVTVPSGTSVMRAAALAGTAVPKLCATDTLKAFGSCRLCLVEIEGRKGYPASCTTTVAPGMKIRTQSEKLTALRRGVLDLYLSDHPLDPSGARTELRDVAGTVGLTHTSYEARPARAAMPRDESNPYFTFDPEQCIVCSRCVRACDEVQGTFALTIQGRGLESKVAASQDESFLESECVSCGACVEACPDRRAHGEVDHRPRPAGARRHHDLRLLRRGLQLQGRGSRQRWRGRGRAHGAESRRPRESRPCLRQGPLRLRLRDARRSRSQADDPQDNP